MEIRDKILFQAPTRVLFDKLSSKTCQYRQSLIRLQRTGVAVFIMMHSV